MDVTALRPIIFSLMRLTLSHPTLKSRAFQILNLFKSLPADAQQRVFEEPVIQLLPELLKTKEIDDICALGPFLGPGTHNIPLVLSKLDLKSRNTTLMTAFLLTFTTDRVNFEQFEQQICQQTRQPQQHQFELTIYLLCSILISQDSEEIADHWTNIVEFIIAGNQLQVSGMEVAAYLLGLKCPEKQIYIGFLPQKEVGKPREWLIAQLLSLMQQN